jgi:translocation and assembly module TamB
MTDPVEIRGQGVEMVWGGKISLNSSAGKTRVSGAIEAKPGRLRMIGNIFDIESGIITFPASGDMDPFVDLVASVRTQEALVTATLKGRAAKPDLVLTSEPPMNQYQILALLITGKSDTTLESDDETDIPTQAASLLMSFNNPELERQLYEKLGVDRISLSMGSTLSEPIVAVGKRIGRRVYVESEYHHNAPEGENRAAGRLEYRLAPGWSLETEYGDAQKGEVGVYWQRRFGEKKKREDDAKSTTTNPPTNPVN